MNSSPPGIHSDAELEALFASDSAHAINEYLALQEESEVPRTYLTWSLIAATGALLGKNAKFRSGANLNISPNMFVILIGPSGVRKTTAIRMTQAMLESTTLHYGPTDTGGQRHGIMSSLNGLGRRNFHAGWRESGIGPITESLFRPRSSDDMFLVAPELGRLMGTGSREMADFLVDLYDGSPIDYQTKVGEVRIDNPMASLLGATTPSSLADIMPANAATHGIFSRALLIYADKPHKSVPLPPEQPPEWYERRERLITRLRWIDYNRTPFSLDESARATYTRLYPYVPVVDDPRMESYKARRNEHMLKVAMCLCALRSDTTVTESDVTLSHELLAMAEPEMKRGLEYFGRNKAYAGRMLMIDFLKNAPNKTASLHELVAAAASELNNREANDAIQSMVASNQLATYGAFYTLGSEKNVLIQKSANVTRIK
jgi:energy-coupling factor transporter ATP-binding protein EcfA2